MGGETCCTDTMESGCRMSQETGKFMISLFLKEGIGFFARQPHQTMSYSRIRLSLMAFRGEFLYGAQLRISTTHSLQDIHHDSVQRQSSTFDPSARHEASFITVGIWQISRRKEASMLPFPPGCRGVAFQDIRYPREEVEAAGWHSSQELGRSSVLFISREVGQDGR
jgi:hypothetical protein